ncbi:Heat shock protein 22 [Portunus trituberculatus]|uniref:Heat shock protein 22 n=1 Tax=Portunus trituberculatus TaxID=210409 RepID=A0A5B7CK97_PORTR|nr:Heat shock protein 22 [Portunus trituberculatus]
MDETELVVEGQVERDTGDSKSSDHFLRRFVLPKDSQLDNISSVMSSDGVLTVIVPKQRSVQQVSDSSEAAEKGLQQSALQMQKLSERCSEISSKASVAAASSSDQASTEQTDIVIPVQVESSADSSKIEQGISVEKRVNFNEDDDHDKMALNKECASKDNNEVDAVHRRLQEEGEEEDDSKSGMAALRRLLEEDETYIKHKNKSIPIDEKGVFFNNRDFSGWQQCFLSAVKDLLNKFNEPSSPEGDLAAYRKLRQRDLKLENQAAYVDENLQAHTIVLDVYDFLSGKVTAEVKDGRELIVRGTAQRLEGTSLITLTFVRPFRLPDNADLKNITAFLTSDGVLLINVPRLKVPYELPDLGGARVREPRPRLSTPCDPCRRLSSERNLRESSSDLDGVTYRISPHRNLKGEEHSSGERQ